jgi:proteasome accessory factor C
MSSEPKASGKSGVSEPKASGKAQKTGRPGASDRLQRLLALVPYVVSRQAAGLAETAAAFGVSETELVDDLNLLWCVELRSPDPYCPIDLSYEGGEITVSQAESIGRPLRLGTDEASALLVALRMLAELPGPQGGCTCRTTCPAGTRRPSATWTRCGWSFWRGEPTWRGGAAGRRRSGCSGSTACSR